MICSVGIGLYQGRHRARCLDDRAQPCDSPGTSTSLPWLMVAVYLRPRHPDCRLVKARTQEVAALRRHLRGPVKSGRLDALTSAIQSIPGICPL